MERGDGGGLQAGAAAMKSPNISGSMMAGGANAR
jgi:hypothetical protein